ncbi:Gfo/Idh/MocA family oxidoreductase [Piscinibacter sp. XHJ-5]|uniref:Gfo/Idh/MocA family protein n=1 Tax=Piscinibacter sp. XHJ-5 TaxID=3037797 RepID=UPI002452CEFE|nr:Gfo/Idh/MocA family oxidoreductase [Piscinibacter sp. XHJ-5]
MNAALKFLRFVSIYGAGRTLFKAAGRLRLPLPAWSLRRAEPDIALVGCGQFGFATIGYFLQSAFGRRIRACYDIDPRAQSTLARAMGVPLMPASFDELIADPGVRIVYIASNHASHADYAVQALARGLDVYVEKPVAVSHAQLVTLLRAVRDARGRVFAGYNRPFSAAVRLLRGEIGIDPAGGFSVQCFVSGHRLAADHWYRRPDEGTRICGNVGHWLDLMVHIWAWRSLPDLLHVTLAWADPEEPDDNLAITIASDRGDIFTVMLTSRSEPFEGINETICLQHGETTCKIDDFRRLTLWRGSRLLRRRFWPKDVGHRGAILQPFREESRDWQEVVLSTLLMLHITDMVKRRQRESTFSLEQGRAALAREIDIL